MSGAEEFVTPSELGPVVALPKVSLHEFGQHWWLDGVDLEAEFQRRAAIMKTVPHLLRGPYRSAMRLAMREAFHDSEQRRQRGWKLLLLLPRLLLFRPCRGGNVHKEKLSKRFQNFSDGRWTKLLVASRSWSTSANFDFGQFFFFFRLRPISTSANFWMLNS